MIVDVLSYAIKYFRSYELKKKHFLHRINAEIQANKYSNNALLKQTVANVLDFVVAVVTITIQLVCTH